ncbi:MAG: hypothetical protein GXP15_16440 [Gammaproteobacteria bacterium]|nr:hypothetical protein [Gammaproteobacteria bacterium]
MALTSFFLTACGPRISGTYGDEQGITVYKFDRDGRANVFVLGRKIAAEYTLDGDKVLVTSPQGTVVLTRNGDKLFGPMGLELTRRAN